MAKKQTFTKPPVRQEVIDECLAEAIAQGDIVNFRFMFTPNSPLRNDSTEIIDTPKYAYLRAEDTASPRYRDAFGLARSVEMHERVRRELDKKGPPQLPAEMLLPLADNAVRLGKYTAAAQAYELLRIRERMQREFAGEMVKRLDAGDVAKSVRAGLIAAGLAYNYAAFPEPLPLVPNYQARALMMHAEYPAKPENCPPLREPELQINAALDYLLLDTETAALLQEKPRERRLAFLEELIRRKEPNWDAFVQRYRQACAVCQELAEQFQGRAEAGNSLAEEIALDQRNERLRKVPAELLGRAIENGEWWQYLKELATEHPAAVLFVGRQAITKDEEIIMPRYRRDFTLVEKLGLAS